MMYLAAVKGLCKVVLSVGNHQIIVQRITFPDRSVMQVFQYSPMVIGRNNNPLFKLPIHNKKRKPRHG